MASKGSPMLQPISLIFRYLQNSTRVSIWLYDNGEERMEGVIIGFDEFMNLTLDATTLYSITNPTNSREELGRILLKGDNITLIRAVEKE